MEGCHGKAVEDGGGPDYGSEDAEISRAMAEVPAATEGRGIWGLDRGGDRGKLFDDLLDKRLRFIIRLRGDRSLGSGGLGSALTVANDCPGLFVEYVAKEESDQERPLRLEVGYRKVHLPGRRELLTLVVVRSFGSEPLMLLTDWPVKRSRKSLWHIVAAYLSPRSVGETIGIKHFLFSKSKGLKQALPLPKPQFVQRFLFDI
jgi:hypothetical protein